MIDRSSTVDLVKLTLKGAVMENFPQAKLNKNKTRIIFWMIMAMTTMVMIQHFDQTQRIQHLNLDSFVKW